VHADVVRFAMRLQAQLPQIQVLTDKLREAHEQLNVAEFNATEASIAAEALVATLQARASCSTPQPTSIVHKHYRTVFWLFCRKGRGHILCDPHPSTCSS
jgi:hypothetical protein